MIKKAALLFIFIIFFASTAKADPPASTVKKPVIKTDTAATQSDIPLTSESIYQIAPLDGSSSGGNLSITGNIPGTKTGVIFVRGNLYINPESKQLVYNQRNAGIVFIVKGNVYINKLVEQIDAVIIAEGIICTAATDAATCPTTNVSAEQLIINGSLISLNQTDTVPIKFMRTRGALDASEPAEKIVYQPKYLVILRNLVSDTFEKWSEIQ